MIEAASSLSSDVPVSAGLRPRVPLWIVASGLYLVAASLLMDAPRWEMSHPGGHEGTLAVRLVIEATALLWAAQRVALPRRFRQALALLGFVSLVSAATSGLLLVEGQSSPQVFVKQIDETWTLLSYVVAALALILVPRVPSRPGEGITIALDSAITAGTFGALLLIELSFPLMDEAARAHAEDARLVFLYGLAQIFYLLALNVVIARGAASPSRRAFWWFVAGQAAYVPVLVLAQLELAGVVGHTWLDGLYMLGVVPTLVAAIFIRYDEVGGASSVAVGPPWWRDLNPLLLVAPALTAATLFTVLRAGPSSRVVPVSVLLACVAVLLAVRLVLSVHQNARLEQREIDRTRRMQADKLTSVGELAGGIAHEFGNLLTVVGGRADLAMGHLEHGHDAIEDLQAIRAQTERAAQLTGRLAAFSGRRAYRRRPWRVADIMRESDAALRGALGTDNRLAIWCASPGAHLSVDLKWFVVALAKVVKNAGEATTSPGTVTLAVGLVDLTAPPDNAHLPVAAGRYVSFAVGDEGRGVPPEDLPRLFDPFFSRQPTHPGAGLDLAEVYGIVKGHDGGIAVASELGRGTTVTIYLPAIGR